MVCVSASLVDVGLSGIKIQTQGMEYQGNIFQQSIMSVTIILSVKSAMALKEV